MRARYSRNSTACFSLKYHLVWCSKYRRPVLVDEVAADLKALISEKAKEIEATLHALEVMPDHVHVFVESDPRWCPAEIAHRLKGYTSHELRQRHAWLRSRLPTLWSRSYFIATVGNVTGAAVKKYIESQKGK